METIKSKAEIEKIIEEVVVGFLEKMNITGEIEIKNSVSEKEGENLVCNVKTDQSSFLIGQYGMNLQAFQHLVRVILRKKIKDRFDFVLDINSYRQEKNESILSLADAMANKSVIEKKTVTLRPMSSYERRLVHMRLSENSEVVTESIGEGEERQIVIKPASLV